MEYFVDVALAIPLEKLFTYSISKEEADFIKPGMRIAVPFGKKKIYTAIAIQVHTNPPTAYEAKSIELILDETPLINTIQLEHWQWLANYYMCTFGEVVKAALPKAFLLESETIIVPNSEIAVNESELTDNEFLIYEALENQNSLSIQDIIQITDRKQVLPIVNSLLAKNVIQVHERIYEEYKPKMIRHVKFSSLYASDEALQDLLDELSRAPKQREAVLHLFQLQAGKGNAIKVSELVQKSGCSSAIIKSLIDKNVFEELQIRTDRVVFNQINFKSREFELSAHQLQAFNTIKEGFKANKPVLLYGVTSSGKTEVYFELITEAINRGEQVLYLLPEIALTSQLISRLQEHFGEKVAVYHSKYSVNERVEVWNNVLHQKQKAQITIGARSSLFLPFSNLGLLIVDEEHESSFKQFDPAPRYHARDAALVLAKLHKAQCLLGSATPSIESYKNAKDGKYHLAKMTERFGNVLMPKIELIDIKEATRKKKMKGHFSELLLEQMWNALNEKEQLILFQNRRGFAPVVECTTCGHSERCPNCDVSLTYHQYKKQLRCHYCGYHELLGVSCKACGNNTLETQGFGTEQIEQELQNLFPEAKTGRMDLDTTRGKYGYQKIIKAFENHEIDILVGTQMITKGLDFRNVGMVGIMNADTLLNFPDYRAHEKSYQLLTQVAGRAGRTEKQGKVFIQTYNPFHKILQQVSTNSFEEMFNEQLYEREQFLYPPKVRILKITLKSKDYNRLNEGAIWLAKSLRTVFGSWVLGPEPPVVSRIKRDYLNNIIIKIPAGNSVSKAKKSIKKVQNSFDAIGVFKNIRLVYNVDHI